MFLSSIKRFQVHHNVLIDRVIDVSFSCHAIVENLSSDISARSDLIHITSVTSALSHLVKTICEYDGTIHVSILCHLAHVHAMAYVMILLYN